MVERRHFCEFCGVERCKHTKLNGKILLFQMRQLQLCRCVSVCECECWKSIQLHICTDPTLCLCVQQSLENIYPLSLHFDRQLFYCCSLLVFGSSSSFTFQRRSFYVNTCVENSWRTTVCVCERGEAEQNLIFS